MTQRRALWIVVAFALFGAGFVTGYFVRPTIADVPAMGSVDAAPYEEHALDGRSSDARTEHHEAEDGGEPADHGAESGGARENGRVSIVGEADGDREATAASERAGEGTTGSTPPRLDGGTPPSGHLDAVAIRDVVREHRERLGFCFAWQLHSHPELGGSLTMDFTIGADGSVTRAEIADDQLGDETVLNCFRNETRRMRFPPPEDGEVRVRYPFRLAADPPEGSPPGPSHASSPPAH